MSDTKVVTTLEPGDWVEMRYGFDRRPYYILRASSTEIKWCSPRWLVEHATTSTIEEFMFWEPVYLGKGKKRWWAKWTGGFFAPFARPPHERRTVLSMPV